MLTRTILWFNGNNSGKFTLPWIFLAVKSFLVKIWLKSTIAILETLKQLKFPNDFFFKSLFHSDPFKRQPHKMDKHIQTIRRQTADELFKNVWPFCGVGA